MAWYDVLTEAELETEVAAAKALLDEVRARGSDVSLDGNRKRRAELDAAFANWKELCEALDTKRKAAGTRGPTMRRAVAVMGD